MTVHKIYHRQVEMARTRPRSSRRPRSRRRRVLIIGGTAVVAIEAVALVIGLGFLGTSSAKELDVAQAEAGVVQTPTP